jgi:hypothetical protein
MAKTRIRPPASTEELLDQLGIQVSSVGYKEISAHCPFHKDSHPSFSINIDTQLWTCYQCGRGGSIEMLLSEIADVKDPTEFLREIQLQRVAKKRNEPKEKPEPVSSEQTDPYLIQARFETFKRVPSWALRDRNLRRRDIDTFNVKWDKGWVLPITDEEGLLGWQWKRLDSVRNYPRTVKKSLTLFGLQQVEDTTIALVESPLDVVRLAAVHVTAVSSFGAFVSKTQVRLLIDAADRIILALDNDEEGQKQTARIFPYVNRFVPTKIAQMPEGAKDPGDCDDEQLSEIFA